MKKIILNAILAVLILASLVIVLCYKLQKKEEVSNQYEDGVEQIDLNTIRFEDSKVEVNFSDVLLSKQEEKRKLIVSTQEGNVSTNLSEKTISWLDWEGNIKTQKVTYTGKGYFVVDLDGLSKEDFEDDKENKVLTIKIPNAHLEEIVIDPNQVYIGDVKEALIARGDIQLTVKDYTTIEKELKKRLEEKFNTAENGQKANEIALRMVKEIYEPVVKAIDKNYSVEVAFQNE